MSNDETGLLENC